MGTIAHISDLHFGRHSAAAADDLLASLRERDPDPRSRARKLGELAESGLVDSLARGDRAHTERIVVEHIGAGLVELGLDPALFDFECGVADHSPR